MALVAAWRHLVYVSVSTGVGGGVVVDGRLLHGRRGMAGHVGHLRMALEGPVCSCGTIGCFEASLRELRLNAAPARRQRCTQHRQSGAHARLSTPLSVDRGGVQIGELVDREGDRSGRAQSGLTPGRRPQTGFLLGGHDALADVNARIAAIRRMSGVGSTCATNDAAPFGSWCRCRVSFRIASLASFAFGIAASKHYQPGPIIGTVSWRPRPDERSLPD